MKKIDRLLFLLKPSWQPTITLLYKRGEPQSTTLAAAFLEAVNNGTSLAGIETDSPVAETLIQSVLCPVSADEYSTRLAILNGD